MRPDSSSIFAPCGWKCIIPETRLLFSVYEIRTWSCPAVWVKVSPQTPSNTMPATGKLKSSSTAASAVPDDPSVATDVSAISAISFRIRMCLPPVTGAAICLPALLLRRNVRTGDNRETTALLMVEARAGVTWLLCGVH